MHTILAFNTVYHHIVLQRVNLWRLNLAIKKVQTASFFKYLFAVKQIILAGWSVWVTLVAIWL